ncbi:MAG: sigma-70 family RNA polymerase sigma factor [Pseudonocardia sp.]
MEIDLKALYDLDDAGERATQASRLVTEYSSAVTELSRIRKEALEELIGQGKTQTELAAMLGMTRARVGQLLSSGPKSERAFLGTGTLTIAVGGKLEADKRGTGRVLAQEDLAAFNRMQDLARAMGLDAKSEVVEPPGMVNLNRDNLVIICGPRLSPLISQVLESDRNLGFEKDEQGWYLIDRPSGTIHRSPMDSGQNADIAYLGRLPRLDGRGSFLYIAGIHAIGAPGVVHYLENHLTELYSEVKTRRFSVLISSTFDPKTLDITASERISPLYRGEGA